MKQKDRSRLQTTARNNFLKGKNRKPIQVKNYFDKRHKETIDVDTKCVKAIRISEITDANSSVNYKYGDDSKKYVVSENGYMISFAKPKSPEPIGQLKDKRRKKTTYVGVWGSGGVCSSEQLHRVIWFSFAMDAIENNTNIPKLTVYIDGRLMTEADGLTQEQLIRLMSEKAHEHDGIKPSRFIKKEYVVHHIRLNTHNNSIDNLLLTNWWMHDDVKNSLHKEVDALRKRGEKVESAQFGIASQSDIKDAFDESIIIKSLKDAISVKPELESTLNGKQLVILRNSKPYKLCRIEFLKSQIRLVPVGFDEYNGDEIYFDSDNAKLIMHDI